MDAHKFEPHYCDDCKAWFYKWDDLCGHFLKAYEAYDYDPKEIERLIPMLTSSATQP